MYGLVDFDQWVLCLPSVLERFRAVALANRHADASQAIDHIMRNPNSMPMVSTETPQVQPRCEAMSLNKLHSLTNVLNSVTIINNFGQHYMHCLCPSSW